MIRLINQNPKKSLNICGDANTHKVYAYSEEKNKIHSDLHSLLGMPCPWPHVELKIASALKIDKYTNDF